MQIPVDITFRGMDRSPALERAIRTWVTRLERDHDGIMRCAIVVEQPHQHQSTHKPFQIHINLTLAGRDIAVSHVLDEAGQDDPYVALGDAFRAARRQLRTYVEVRRERQRHA